MRIRSKQQTLLWSLTILFVIFLTITNLKILLDTQNIIEEFQRDKNLNAREIRTLKIKLGLELKEDESEVQRSIEKTTSKLIEAKVVNDESEKYFNEEEFRNSTFDEIEKEYRKFYLYLTKKQKICEQLIFIGDGKKELMKFQQNSFPVCLDKKFWNKDDCIVYSYQIDNRWHFDDFLSETKKCEVHSFDANNYDEVEHIRESGVHFHKFAIGHVDSKNIYQKGKRDYLFRKKYDVKELEKLRKIEMKTFGTTRKNFNHEKKTINLLRIDAEGSRISYEFAIIDEIVRNKSYQCLQQISLHLHFYTPLLPPETEDASPQVDIMTSAKQIVTISRLFQRFEIESGFRVCSSTTFDSNGNKIHGASEFIESLRNNARDDVTFLVLLCNTRLDTAACG